MSFSQGQIVFAVFFLIAFVAGIAWAYRKDYEKNKQYFKGAFYILLSILAIYFLFFLFVRIFN